MLGVKTLDRVTRVVRLGISPATTPEFRDHPRPSSNVGGAGALPKSGNGRRTDSAGRPITVVFTTLCQLFDTTVASLSHRERQVMALVARGLLNRQMGGELGSVWAKNT
jgi:hypothetical protein